MKWEANKKYSKKQWAIALVAIMAVLIAAAVLMDHPPQSVQSETMPSSAASISENDAHISIDEYEKIKTGMSYDQVKEIVGSDGENIFESGDKGTDNYQISYMWRGKDGGEATISFSGKDKLTVLMKSQSRLKQ